MINSVNGVYLNNAGQAPLSLQVQSAGCASIRDNLIQHSDTKRIRELFATIVHDKPENIAILPSTAFAISLAAFNSCTDNVTDGRIVLIQDQYDSAVYPWQAQCQKNKNLSLKIVQTPKNDNETWTSNILQALNDPKVKIACLPPLHWSDGSLIDLTIIGKACKSRNISLIVDATQAAGIMPCKVCDIQPDMLVSSVHKWLRSPSGVALAHINPRLHEKWMPLDEHGRGRLIAEIPDWNARPNNMGANGYYPDEFFKDARKFDSGGKANNILLPMLQTGLEQVVQIDPDVAQEQLKALIQPLLEFISSTSYFQLTPGPHANHLVGLRPTRQDDNVVAIQNYLAENGVYVAARSGALRISPYIDNTSEDIEKLIDVLREYFDNKK